MAYIFNEQDEIKVEMEELKKECRVKTELSDSLRKAHAEQQAKIQQAQLEIEKLAQELNGKSEEIHEIRKMYEELQSSLLKKDLLLQQISSANEKLRAEYGEKILKLETENKDLVLALDEASARILDLKKKTSASSEEIAGLKRLLSVKQEKGFEAEKNASKNVKEREEYILKLEEESRNTENQLKWKNEQFSYLEEAHLKLQTEFQESKTEWEKEKSSLIDEISSLQAKLDAQVRISERLDNELRMSHQALAREESQRKVLEIEVSESRSQFKNVFQECQVAKSEIELLTMKRDEEIAELRMLVRKKEMVANEMKYRTAQLEQENIDLLGSLKDFQEAELSKNKATSSSKMLRNKLHSLQQLHNKCAINLKEKESEWNSQIEKLRADMNNCLLELNCKTKSMRELHKEQEDCQWLLEVKNDEIFALILVLKSEFNVAYSKMHDEKEKLEMSVMQIEKENMLINQQLESKNIELHEVHAELKQRCDEIAVLMQRLQSLDSLKQKNNFTKEELKRYEVMLNESNECQRSLKQQFLQLEEIQRDERTNASDALEMVKSELAKKTSEAEKYKLELQNMKSEAESLKINYEEIQQAHKQENASLLVILKDRDAQIGKLQEQICVLESVIVAKSEAEEIHKQEMDNSIQLAEDTIAQLKNELIEREAGGHALLDAHNNLKRENENFSSNIKEKDQKIQVLQKQIESLDQNLRSAVISLAEKEITLDEALKRVEGQKNLAIEEKNQIIAKLEKEVNALSKEVEFQEKTVVQTKQEIETSLQAKKLEMEEMKSQFGDERKCFKALLEELESDKDVLLQNLSKASVDREKLLAQFEGICEQIGVFCRDDVELTGMLTKMLQNSEEDSEPASNLLASDGLIVTTFSPSRKLIQASFNERPPLTELNS
ncbi:hypothetical protein BUALT_Bualt15G0062200 [Buddleja alternifolia]|uniref:Uncharacterized protein n=1 Tax=Buddleja alternifolia TaxID=168488 RepID=A0AAV6WL94_9LAMI|nr:hypothetical protein BUALT_Bualt15G0062200 [Buddleja alternifolia]